MDNWSAQRCQRRLPRRHSTSGWRALLTEVSDHSSCRGHAPVTERTCLLWVAVGLTVSLCSTVAVLQEKAVPRHGCVWCLTVREATGFITQMTMSIYLQYCKSMTLICTMATSWHVGMNSLVQPKLVHTNVVDASWASVAQRHDERTNHISFNCRPWMPIDHHACRVNLIAFAYWFSCSAFINRRGCFDSAGRPPSRVAAGWGRYHHIFFLCECRKQYVYKHIIKTFSTYGVYFSYTYIYTCEHTVASTLDLTTQLWCDCGACGAPLCIVKSTGWVRACVAL